MDSDCIKDHFISPQGGYEDEIENEHMNCFGDSLCWVMAA